MSNKRRVPQQDRAERRVAQLLESASAVFAEAGYDAATMTEIAERANASIGAVYQYFPNKEAIVRALRVQYGNEMQKRWTDLESITAGLTVPQIADYLVDVMVRFVEEHPAYFPVLDAPVKYKRDQEGRRHLREQLANVFRNRKPALSQERAYRMANVSLQIIKSMNVLYGEANSRERSELVKEYKLALAAYLESQLISQRSQKPTES
ncbi:TetR/AcrR family transcriptional regulator [Acidicapsa acidisoli]|uniref:TetR/AcrR family transcriptional regulator n=1 Tax=Acidicapsa acidisoli TaxID=1615681 RepID=UPI0021DFAF2C|nr:TetR/AcrR family transcriptional regulator [Acidicapsa acidisoli]